MNSKAQASLEFLIVFAALISLIVFYLGVLHSFGENVENSLNFQFAKSKSLACAFAVNSLAANSAFSLPYSFNCFLDLNNNIGSSFNGKSAFSSVIPKTIVFADSEGLLLEVEGFEHYK